VTWTITKIRGGDGFAGGRAKWGARDTTSDNYLLHLRLTQLEPISIID
jgi:hypothetical protein